MQQSSRTQTRPQDTPLFDLVFQRISKSPERSIPFSEYLEIVLYDERHGYYADPWTRGVGRTGDFYTSVSVGETFGFLLALALAKAWRERFSETTRFVVVEQGAHDGRLALDVVNALVGIEPSLGDSLEYRIVEPRERLRGELSRRLAESPAGSRIKVLGSLVEARAPEGVFLCNELLDAFPFRCLIFTAGAWKERCVSLDGEGGGFLWTFRPLPNFLEEFAAELGDGFSEGYVTEVCPAVDEWVGDAAGLFGRGLWWLIDYGWERPEYYSPHRVRGTLRCFEGHRATEDPFGSLGSRDITAHVDFTRVESAARRAGLKLLRFTDQHHFLIEAARPWLRSLEGAIPDVETAKRLRQFQTLTHPSMMGRQFKVMELGRGVE